MYIVMSLIFFICIFGAVILWVKTRRLKRKEEKMTNMLLTTGAIEKIEGEFLRCKWNEANITFDNKALTFSIPLKVDASSIKNLGIYIGDQYRHLNTTIPINDNILPLTTRVSFKHIIMTHSFYMPFELTIRENELVFKLLDTQNAYFWFPMDKSENNNNNITQIVLSSKGE